MTNAKELRRADVCPHFLAWKANSCVAPEMSNLNVKVRTGHAIAQSLNAP
jgi:hypothetical protein